MYFPIQPSEREFELALECLSRGGIVAYPTETFYGLAVDLENEQAITALYALKGREEQKPISLIIHNATQLSSLVRTIPGGYRSLIDTFWPGPLTLIFPAKKHISPLLTGGGATLAIRISSHPVAIKLCQLWGGALTATSANRSGEAPLVSAQGVDDMFKDELSFVLDGGVTPGGQGSTIVHCSDREEKCTLIREGVINISEISPKLPSHYNICKS